MEKGFKLILEKLYKEMNNLEKVKKDPVSFPHKFNREEDIEISAFISACFAFGRVDKILETLEKIFLKMENSPWDYLKTSSRSDIENDFKGFVYRFVDEKAIAEFLKGLSGIVKKGGLYIFIEDNIFDTASTIYQTLFYFAEDTNALKKSNLLCDIKKKSACKRLNLFFRWMVRRDNVDFGLWQKKIKPDNLVIPLDTHILRISGRLGLTHRKDSSLKTAVDITESLKLYHKYDPVRYDFSLCHTGIQGICNKDIKKAKCSLCYLKEYCIEGKMKEKNLSED